MDHRHQIVYTQDLSTDPVRFFVNGKQFDPNRVDQVMHLGKVEQWTIKNRSDEWHTFHCHVLGHEDLGMMATVQIKR